jgi:hypothetical protein
MIVESGIQFALGGSFPPLHGPWAVVVALGLLYTGWSTHWLTTGAARGTTREGGRVQVAGHVGDGRR